MGKQVFVDVIKNFEIIWIIRVGPKGNHKCPYEAAGGDETHTHTCGDNVKTSRDWSNVATAKECQQLLEAGREQ